jgi:ATP-dependent protease ClpP protease subunit
MNRSGFTMEKQENKEEPKKEIIVQEPKVLETIENRIYFYSEIDRSSILTLNKSIKQLHNDSLYFAQVKGEKPYPIYLHINSYGGSIFAGIAGMDEIIKVSEKLDTITIVDGCCASAATFLSIVGKQRYINRHAYMLIHQLSNVMWGKYEEFKDEMENMDKLMTMIKGLYSQYTKLPDTKIEGILKHDIWFTPMECLEYGLVDKIL